MNKKAFTLIELLIVVTIIALITSGGVMYFFKQVSGLKISSDISKVVDIVDTLDQEIRTRKMSDYSLIINMSNNQRGFSYSTNQIGLSSRQYLDFDSITGSGTLNTIGTSTGSYNFKIYSGIKFDSEQIVDSTDTITKSFLDSPEYSITANLDGDTLNNLHIYYYSTDNILDNTESYLELVKISNRDDTEEYDEVNILNVNGTKVIHGVNGGGNDNMNEVYLYFEKEGIEKFIEIKK